MSAPDYIALDPDLIRDREAEILSVAADQDGEYWGLEHFLLDMPMKWELSFGLSSGGRIRGYMICSRKDGGGVHIHHFMLAPEMRGKGIGGEMLRFLESRARISGAPEVSLKVHKENSGARRFYAGHGYVEKTVQGDYVLMARKLNTPKIAVHQPNYLPWLGYFHKMSRADVFIFLDDAQFTKGGYTNRVRILASNGPRWLTVPIHVSLGQRILEVEPSKKGWKKSHIDLLRNEYRGAGCFKEILPELAAILESAPDSNLAEINISLLMALADKLGIRPRFMRSSEMGVSGAADDRLVNLLLVVAPDASYLSGEGGAKYQDPAKFEAAGLGFEYTNFKHPEYDQGGDEFTSGLSVVDCLLRHGWEVAHGLIKEGAA